MLIASAHYLASRQGWIQSQLGSHFVSVNQTSKLLAWQSAHSLASERYCDYSLCSLLSNALPFYCHCSNTNHKRCQRSSARERACVSVCRLMMNPSFLNSTPLTCHSATEVTLITKPNTITKPSSSALCVCVFEMTVQGFREQWVRERSQVMRFQLCIVCRHMCVLGFRYQDKDWELIGLEITTELSIFYFLKKPPQHTHPAFHHHHHHAALIIFTMRAQTETNPSK